MYKSRGSVGRSRGSVERRGRITKVGLKVNRAGVGVGLVCLVGLGAVILGRQRGWWDRWGFTRKIVRRETRGVRGVVAIIGQEVIAFRDPLCRKVRVDRLESIERMAVHVVDTALASVGSKGEGIRIR